MFMNVVGVRVRESLAVLLLISMALTGCGEEGATGEKQEGAKADSTKADSIKAAQKKKKVPEGVPVKVASVEAGEICSYLLYDATVEAEETADVYTRTTGLVRRVLAEEGDQVRAGQVLVELMDDDLKLSEADARVNYQKLESQFRRKEEMFSRKLLSNEEYEQQKYGLEQARIGWERAKLALAHASVRSPVDGVVAERIVKLGDRIGPSNKLYVLVNMERLIARVHVPGREMRNLSVGRPAVITTDFLPDSTLRGRVMRVSPVVDPGSGTFKVTLELHNTDGQLRPGMFVKSHIVTETHEHAVLVPKRAVVYDDELPHVFVVEDSTASKVKLEVGFEDSNHLEVLSGIERGDLIVVVGQTGLKDQAKVRVIEGEGLQIPARPDTTQGKDQAS